MLIESCRPGYAAVWLHLVMEIASWVVQGNPMLRELVCDAIGESRQSNAFGWYALEGVIRC